MQTNFIELLSATAPEGLEQTAATLCGEVKKLLKARTPKRYLALEPYARNTNLCHYLLDLVTGQPALPEASDTGCRPLLMLLALSEDTEVQNRLLHGLVEPWRKAFRTPEMLYLCDVLYQTRIPRPLYNMCNEVCDYFFVERRKQMSRQPTPLTEAELQYAEKRLKPLYAAVFRLKVNRHEQRGGTGGDALHERIDLPREIQQDIPPVRQQMAAGTAHRADTPGLEIPLRPPAQGDSREERFRVRQPFLGILHGTDEAKPQRAAQGAVRRAVRGTAEVLFGGMTAFPAKNGTATSMYTAIFAVHNR